MVTPRRPWPTVALKARDKSIMELHVAKRELRRLVKDGGGLTPLEQLRCAAVALGASSEALRLLQSTVDNGREKKRKQDSTDNEN